MVRVQDIDTGRTWDDVPREILPHARRNGLIRRVTRGVYYIKDFLNIYNIFRNLHTAQERLDEYYRNSIQLPTVRPRSPGPTPRDNKKYIQPAGPVAGAPVVRRLFEESNNPIPPDDFKKVTVMSSTVAHSSSHCCVDLKGFNIPEKRYRHINQRDLGNKTTVIEKHQWFHFGTQDKDTYAVLGEPLIGSFGGVAGTVIQTYSATDATNGNSMASMMFNDTYNLVKIFGDLGYTAPAYDTAGTAKGVTDANDSDRAVVIQQQYIEFKFKNWGNGTSTADNADNPLNLTVYGYVLKDDIYSESNTGTSEDNYPLMYCLKKGWKTTFDGSTEGSDQLFFADTQYYGTSIKSNSFLNDMCECIGISRNVLAIGQEGTMRFMLKSPQYFTFNDFANAKVSTATSYRNILHRKGTVFFIAKWHGGIEVKAAAAAPTVPNSCSMSAANFALFCTKRYEYFPVLRTLSTRKISYKNATTTNAVNVDVDMQDYFQ